MDRIQQTGYGCKIAIAVIAFKPCYSSWAFVQPCYTQNTSPKGEMNTLRNKDNSGG